MSLVSLVLSQAQTSQGDPSVLREVTSAGFCLQIPSHCCLWALGALYGAKQSAAGAQSPAHGGTSPADSPCEVLGARALPGGVAQGFTVPTG